MFFEIKYLLITVGIIFFFAILSFGLTIWLGLKLHKSDEKLIKSIPYGVQSPYFVLGFLALFYLGSRVHKRARDFKMNLNIIRFIWAIFIIFFGSLCFFFLFNYKKQ